MDDPTPIELSPLAVIALEARLDPFCPVALNGGQYHPGMCLPYCDVCRSLLIRHDVANSRPGGAP